MNGEPTSSNLPAHYIPARPTTYNGVKMRSRLEAAYAEQFDAFGWSWEYEPGCFSSYSGQYLPDFRLVLNELSPEAFTYVEVKPHITVEQAATEVGKMTHWWSTIKASEPEAAAFVLMFGAEAGVEIRWLGLIDEWSTPLYVCPMTYGIHAPRVSICSDPSLVSFCSKPTGVPVPVQSLYADRFFTPIHGTEDIFGLRTNGC